MRMHHRERYDQPGRVTPSQLLFCVVLREAPCRERTGVPILLPKVYQAEAAIWRRMVGELIDSLTDVNQGIKLSIPKFSAGTGRVVLDALNKCKYEGGTGNAAREFSL